MRFCSDFLALKVRFGNIANYTVSENHQKMSHDFSKNTIWMFNCSLCQKWRKWGVVFHETFLVTLNYCGSLLWWAKRIKAAFLLVDLLVELHCWVCSLNLFSKRSLPLRAKMTRGNCTRVFMLVVHISSRSSWNGTHGTILLSLCIEML